MALIKGTNCGFLDVAPSGDPGGGAYRISDRAWAFRDITEVGDSRVTEIGWYSAVAVEEANYEVGIYEHDAGNDKPSALVGIDTVNAKGVTEGWKRVTGLDITVSGSTTYWISVQVDGTSPVSRIFQLGDAGEKVHNRVGATQLDDPWGTADYIYDFLAAIYAVVESGEGNGERHSGSLVKNGAALETEPGLYI